MNHDFQKQKQKPIGLEQTGCLTYMFLFLSVRDLYCLLVTNKAFTIHVGELIKQRQWSGYQIISQDATYEVHYKYIHHLTLHNPLHCDAKQLDVILKSVSHLKSLTHDYYPSRIKCLPRSLTSLDMQKRSQLTDVLTLPENLQVLELTEPFEYHFPKVALFGGLKSLKSLTIRRSFQLSHLQNLSTNLQTLNIVCSDVSEVNENVIPQSVTSLSISSYPQIPLTFTARSLPTNLTYLELSATYVTFSSGSSLPSALQSLIIRGNCHNTISSLPLSLTRLEYCGCSEFFGLMCSDFVMKKRINNINEIYLSGMCKLPIVLPQSFIQVSNVKKLTFPELELGSGSLYRFTSLSELTSSSLPILVHPLTNSLHRLTKLTISSRAMFNAEFDFRGLFNLVEVSLMCRGRHMFVLPASVTQLFTANVVPNLSELINLCTISLLSQASQSLVDTIPTSITRCEVRDVNSVINWTRFPLLRVLRFRRSSKTLWRLKLPPNLQILAVPSWYHLTQMVFPPSLKIIFVECGLTVAREKIKFDNVQLLTDTLESL